MFRPILPEFSECWWDSLILDFIICNGTGIYIGQYLGKKFEFSPRNWPDYTLNNVYRTSHTPKYVRVIELTLLSLGSMVLELNSFFIKETYAPYFTHWINILRFTFFCLLAIPASGNFPTTTT
ncbi:hypothetical protein MXB_3083 [Myxobolus squamalis]|nr:hypothetical protein MXB_3083 [Myxobolus squamalis]